MKRFKVILMFMLFTLIISGCGKEKTPANEKPIGGVEENSHTMQVEVKAQSLPASVADMIEVTSYVGDTDADGIDEKIVLATSAERNVKGEFLWNDGQNWALYVEDGQDGTYVLLNEYVQAGNVYFDVSDYYLKDGAKPVILVTVSTGAGLSIKKYAFEKERTAYIEEIVFDTKNVTEGGINRRFSSIPEIVK